MRTPARPPLDGLKKRLDRSRAERERMPRDGFLRETFVLPRTDARDQGQGMVRPLAQAGLLDRDRKLVRAAGRRHRVHDQAAAGGGLSVSDQAAASPPVLASPAGPPCSAAGICRSTCSRSRCSRSGRRAASSTGRSCGRARRARPVTAGSSPRASACGLRAAIASAAPISASEMPTSCAILDDRHPPQHVAAVAALVA